MSDRRPDASQTKVIQLPADARVIVEAGPGYGKTDVACARVAHLIGNGVEPSKILLLSFTRTAVREMRARIRQLVEAGVAVHEVEIRTLDSFAWRLRVGLSEKSKTLKYFGYEESIRETCGMLEEPDDQLQEYLERFEHVFVDEAQDLIGARAELVVHLLNSVQGSCGWTVFLDPAQAIYGWAEDGTTGVQGRSFLDSVGSLSSKPQRLDLKVLHRTGDPRIKKLVLDVRELVLGRKPRGKTRVDAVRGRIDELATKRAESAVDLIKALGPSDSMLVLFRSRFEALQCSGFLSKDTIAHRLRFGALPQPVAGWIASVAQRAKGQVLDRAEFDTIWSTIAGTWGARGWEPEGAWRVLRKLGAKGRGQVSLPDAADRLAMAMVPDELSVKEVGPGGPIIGTIHGSKGREADCVLACMPAHQGKDQDVDEEARVLYVAVTRARKHLHVLDGRNTFWSSAHGRVWRRTAKGHVQLEIGRPGDVDPVSCVAAHRATAIQIQDALESFDGVSRDITSKAECEFEWERSLTFENGAGPACLGALAFHKGGDLLRDVWSIAASAWNGAKPGNYIAHMRWFDVTTVALRADDPRLDQVPAPYRGTRIWLAPVIAGLGVMTKPWRNG